MSLFSLEIYERKTLAIPDLIIQNDLKIVRMNLPNYDYLIIKK